VRAVAGLDNARARPGRAASCPWPDVAALVRVRLCDSHEAAPSPGRGSVRLCGRGRARGLVRGSVASSGIQIGARPGLPSPSRRRPRARPRAAPRGRPVALCAPWPVCRWMMPHEAAPVALCGSVASWRGRGAWLMPVAGLLLDEATRARPRATGTRHEPHEAAPVKVRQSATRRGFAVSCFSPGTRRTSARLVPVAVAGRARARGSVASCALRFDEGMMMPRPSPDAALWPRVRRMWPRGRQSPGARSVSLTSAGAASCGSCPWPRGSRVLLDEATRARPRAASSSSRPARPRAPRGSVASWPRSCGSLCEGMMMPRPVAGCGSVALCGFVRLYSMKG